MVRECTSRCNTVENMHEVIGPRDRVRKTKTIIKKVLFLVRSQKQSNNSHFHFSQFFSFFIFPASVSDLFLSLLPFLILEIKKTAFSVESPYHKDSSTSRPLIKVKPCSAGFVHGWVTKYVFWQGFFSFFFSLTFSRRYLRLQNSQPCVMSFLLHVFINYLFLISPCPYFTWLRNTSCVTLFIYNVV